MKYSAITCQEEATTILAAKMANEETAITSREGIQLIKPISSPHTHWLGLSVEIITGPLKMQVVILPTRFLCWLFISDSLVWGGEEGILAGSLKEEPGTLRKGASHRGWWTVVVFKAPPPPPPLLWKRCRGGWLSRVFPPFQKESWVTANTSRDYNFLAYPESVSIGFFLLVKLNASQDGLFHWALVKDISESRWYPGNKICRILLWVSQKCFCSNIKK